MSELERRGDRFLRRAVGPLTPARIGGVFGFVLGAALPIVWIQLRHGEVSNLFPMFAIYVCGPIGAVLGAVAGMRIQRRRARHD